MNKEQQRIAIAEACGLTDEEWICAKGEWCFSSCVPDYIDDLNAMHEAEKVLSHEQLESYIFEMHENIRHNHIERYVVTATAAQRAEAFLRTIGKWTTNSNEP